MGDACAALLSSPAQAKERSHAASSIRFASSVDDKNETFVYKLHRMVEDPSHQHLLSWSVAGTSFIVFNGMEFARDVLPKYFKHNNFSSFVRQLNMYGFHKINESPRSPRTNNEQQIWEFSHPRFLRGHPECLADIKRKVVSSSGGRSPPAAPADVDYDMPTGLGVPQGSVPIMVAGGASMSGKRALDPDINQFAVFHSFQNELMRQVAELREHMEHMYRDLTETRRQLGVYQQATRRLVEALSRQQELMPPGLPRAFDPQEFMFLAEDQGRVSMSEVQPAIIVSTVGDTSPHYMSHQTMIPSDMNALYPGFHSGMDAGGVSSQPLVSGHQRTRSFTNAINTPLPPSPLSSPIGSPHGSPMGSPLHGSPLQDQLVVDEDYMHVKQEMHHPWSY